MQRIYFDNAASTPLLPEVIQEMNQTLVSFYGNPSSIHAEGRSARAKIEDARKRIAKHLNASLSEIFFTSGGTESINTAIKCSVSNLGIKRIITTSVEHHATLHAIDTVIKQYGINLTYLEVDHEGKINLDTLEHILTSNSIPTLVCIMHINNELGNIYPIESIGTLCKKNGAYFFTDAVQSVGHLSIDLQQTHVDFLAASAHKFHGPKGVGILYINNNISIHPLIDGGGQERNMRGGTENIHNIVGMATALDAAYFEFSSRVEHISALKNYFKEQLDALHIDIIYNGDINHQSYSILSISFPANTKSDLLLMQLDISGVSASSGSACVSGAEQDSHVLLAINHPSDRKTIRFSFSHFNTFEEIDFVIHLIKSWFPMP